jgi:hypothetical protein
LITPQWCRLPACLHKLLRSSNLPGPVSGIPIFYVKAH